MQLLLAILCMYPFIAICTGNSMAQMHKRSPAPADTGIVEAKDYLGLVHKASKNAIRESHTSGESQRYAEKMSKWLLRGQGSVYKHQGIADMTGQYYVNKMNRCQSQAQMDRTIAKAGSWARLPHLEVDQLAKQMVESAIARYSDEAEQYRLLLQQARALPASQAIQDDLSARMQYAREAATMWEREDAEEAAQLTKLELINYNELVKQGDVENDADLYHWRLSDSATKAIALHMRTQELYQQDEQRLNTVRLPGIKRRRDDA